MILEGIVAGRDEGKMILEGIVAGKMILEGIVAGRDDTGGNSGRER